MNRNAQLLSLAPIHVPEDQFDKVWFTSDYHLFHHNVILFDKRPFENVDEMYQTIKENHNSLVNKNDKVFFLGDLAYNRRHKFTLSKFLKEFNGDWYFILGNHDKDLIRAIVAEPDLGVKFGDACSLRIESPTSYQGRNYIECSHYPQQSWNREFHGSIHLHGHSHLKMEKKKNRLDVGIMGSEYRPYSLNDILISIGSNVLK